MLKPDILRQQISNLLVAYPELQDDEQLRVDMIDAETDALDFISRLVRSIEDARVLADGTDLRIKELMERKARFHRRIDVLRGLIKLMMDTADLRKLELPTATLYLQAGQPRLLGDETNIDHLPKGFIRTIHELNKAALIAELKSGLQVEGFSLSNREPHLVIKVK